jgi:hypothetical protein
MECGLICGVLSETVLAYCIMQVVFFRYCLKDFVGICLLTTITSNPRRHKRMDEVRNIVKNIGLRNSTIISEKLETLKKYMPQYQNFRNRPIELVFIRQAASPTPEQKHSFTACPINNIQILDCY